MWNKVKMNMKRALITGIAALCENVGAGKTHMGLRWILIAESYLHLANPWILATAATLLMASTIAYHSLASLIILALGLLLLALKPYRTWITTQLCLIVGALRNFYTKEIVWAKQIK